MNSTSSAVTGGMTGATAAIAAVIGWILNQKMQLNAPPEVVVSLSAGVVTLGHFICNAINAHATKGN